jgi:hypothetical protein
VLPSAGRRLTDVSVKMTSALSTTKPATLSSLANQSDTKLFVDS